MDSFKELPALKTGTFPAGILIFSSSVPFWRITRQGVVQETR
jgi:hypothetical protein